VTSTEPVNLAFGTRRSILDAVTELEAVIGATLEREHRPARAGDVRHSQADGTRLRELLPDVEPVDFRIGLEATAAWFRTLPEYQGPEVAGGSPLPAAEAAFGATEARPPLRAVPDGP
jgi:UDP-glucose 4-epimerase